MKRGPPLFIPLKGVHFDAFAHGEKRHEWRRHGPRWNARCCWVGRHVVLSRGYSGARLDARITEVTVAPAALPEVVALYGEGTDCLVLTLQLTQRRARSRSSIAGPQ